MAPFFTGITRAIGGAGFGKRAGGAPTRNWSSFFNFTSAYIASGPSGTVQNKTVTGPGWTVANLTDYNASSLRNLSNSGNVVENTGYIIQFTLPPELPTGVSVRVVGAFRGGGGWSNVSAVTFTTDVGNVTGQTHTPGALNYGYWDFTIPSGATYLQHKTSWSANAAGNTGGLFMIWNGVRWDGEWLIDGTSYI